jgi:hypothetical protein
VNGEVTQRFVKAAVDRRTVRDLAELHGRATYACAEVTAIGEVTRDALYQDVLTHLVCDQAERMSPGGADTYRLLADTGAIEMAQVIPTVRRRW